MSVPSALSELILLEAVIKQVKQKYLSFIRKDIGIAIEISDVKKIGEVVISHIRYLYSNSDILGYKT